MLVWNIFVILLKRASYCSLPSFSLISNSKQGTEPELLPICYWTKPSQSSSFLQPISQIHPFLIFCISSICSCSFYCLCHLIYLLMVMGKEISWKALSISLRICFFNAVIQALPFASCQIMPTSTLFCHELPCPLWFVIWGKGICSFSEGKCRLLIDVWFCFNPIHQGELSKKVKTQGINMFGNRT